MPKYQDKLFNALDNRLGAAKDTHYIFLLGTGVRYINEPQTNGEFKCYSRGETFSYLANLTSLIQKETDTRVLMDSDEAGRLAHTYQSDSVDLLDGVDTMGNEVGDRVAKALLLSLAAIGNGSTRLSVSGFSRGGVTGIVLTKEIDRVKRMLEQDALIEDVSERRSLREIILDTKTVPANYAIREYSYTKTALEQLLPTPTESVSSELEEQRKAALLGKLKSFKLDFSQTWRLIPSLIADKSIG